MMQNSVDTSKRIHSQVEVVINCEAAIHRSLKRLEEFTALSHLLVCFESMQFLKYCVDLVHDNAYGT